MTAKIDLPVHQVRAYMEPGPIVLVTSAWQGERNVMTMGWHMVMEFTPSLIGCVIAAGNHSFRLVRDSGACTINIPTVDLIDSVVTIGNTSGREVDKFEALSLDTAQGLHVDAPLLTACHANLECRVADASLVDRYNFFVLEVVKAHIARAPKHPTTLHYTGDGVFLRSGKPISRRADFQPALLGNGR